MARVIDPDIPEDIGERVRKARTQAGLTLDAVAEMTGAATRQRISRIELGKDRPSLAWLWRFALAIGTDPNELDPRLASTEQRQR